MKNSDNNNPILLVGVGAIGKEYTKILLSLGRKVVAVGRGEDSCIAYETATGIKPSRGGVENWLKENSSMPQDAIVAVTIPNLRTVACQLIRAGVKRILLEKPGGVNLQELNEIHKISKQMDSEVYIAYNRRFYSSTLKALEIIKNDGGVKSFHFEFTEWAHVIEKLNHSREVKNAWILCNSSHVIDLAFFLGGWPSVFQSYRAGTIHWHSPGSIFVGAGKTDKNALFSYHANWGAPGRWSLEVMTDAHRLIFRPIEELQIQKKGSVAIEKVEIDNELDKMYKPGFYKQIETFINGDNASYLLHLEEYVKHVSSLYNDLIGEDDP